MTQSARNLCILQIWSMKKSEDVSAKKKPKTSAAQIRVQKGWGFTNLCLDDPFTFSRPDWARPSFDDANPLLWSRWSTQLHFDHYTRRRWVLISWCYAFSVITNTRFRHVQRWRVQILLCHQHQLSSWTPKGQMHTNSMRSFAMFLWLSIYGL